MWAFSGKKGIWQDVDKSIDFAACLANISATSFSKQSECDGPFVVYTELMELNKFSDLASYATNFSSIAAELFDCILTVTKYHDVSVYRVILSNLSKRRKYSK